MYIHKEADLGLALRLSTNKKSCIRTSNFTFNFDHDLKGLGEGNLDFEWKRVSCEAKLGHMLLLNTNMRVLANPA